MGSSKKHKEKREKKRHKRSRSRSHEREQVHRRSHKSKKDSERHRNELENESKKLSVGEEVNKRYFSKVEATTRDSDEDDFDVDKLLDSNLMKNSFKRSLSYDKNADSSRKKKRLVEDTEDYSDSSASRRETFGSIDGGDSNFLSEDRNRSFKDEMQESHADEDLNDEGDGQVQLSLSVSETNKLRAKLGLKPLVVSDSIPGLGDLKEEANAGENNKNEVFVKTMNIAEVKKAEKIKEKIQTMKEKRKINEKLSSVKTLGASDSEDESAASWVKKSRKLQEEKDMAEKRAKLLEEMDAEFGISALVSEEFDVGKKTYCSKDLRGMVVQHDSSMLKEGQQIILTLKDKGVLDEEADVLQNVNLVDEEHYAKNVENKKKKKDYQPYEEEYDEFGILQKKNLLSKYDEEIDGEQKKTFTLGSSLQADKEIEMIRRKLKQQQGVTLEMSNIKLASEYYSPNDMVQFKKPKKRRKIAKTTMLKADDLLPDPQTDNSRDMGSRIRKKQVEDDIVYSSDVQDILKQEDEDGDYMDIEDLSHVVVDEDQAEKELHSALNKARKLKQQTALFAPEKLAREVLKDMCELEANAESLKTGPIVLNSTAEFCRTLGDIPTYGMSGNRDEEADELLDYERELMEERQRLEIEAQNRGAWNEVKIDETPGEIMVRENEPILEEEPDITVGIAGALKLAQKKGYLDKDAKKLIAGPKASQLQAKSYTIEEKFYEDDKFGKRDRYTGPIQDFREKGCYKPDVKLEYIDDSGRLLNAKEAFRYLSHKFHGKGPGKNKVDKRMKKLDQDTKLKQMSSTDTPLNTVKLLQAKQKETQSPFIVLSGGSKTLTQTMISKPKNP